MAAGATGGCRAAYAGGGGAFATAPSTCDGAEAQEDDGRGLGATEAEICFAAESVFTVLEGNACADSTMWLALAGRSPECSCFTVVDDDELRAAEEAFDDCGWLVVTDAGSCGTGGFSRSTSCNALNHAASLEKTRVGAISMP